MARQKRPSLTKWQTDRFLWFLQFLHENYHPSLFTWSTRQFKIVGKLSENHGNDQSDNILTVSIQHGRSRRGLCSRLCRLQSAGSLSCTHYSWIRKPSDQCSMPDKIRASSWLTIHSWPRTLDMADIGLTSWHFWPQNQDICTKVFPQFPTDS